MNKKYNFAILANESPDSHFLWVTACEERKDELDKQPRTVVICHHGMRSTMAAENLIAEGFKQIVNLEGGIDAWASTIDQSMTRY